MAAVAAGGATIATDATLPGALTEPAMFRAPLLESDPLPETETFGCVPTPPEAEDANVLMQFRYVMAPPEDADICTCLPTWTHTWVTSNQMQGKRCIVLEQKQK